MLCACRRWGVNWELVLSVRGPEAFDKTDAIPTLLVWRETHPGCPTQSFAAETLI